MWKFWQWPGRIRHLEEYVDAQDFMFRQKMDIVHGHLEALRTENRQHEAELERFVATKMDYNARIRALELRFDRLEELIKKEAATLRLGGDLNAVGEDFMRRFLADGQRYLDEYEDLLQKYSVR